jgi:hypothetical protein
MLVATMTTRQLIGSFEILQLRTTLFAGKRMLTRKEIVVFHRIVKLLKQSAFTGTRFVNLHASPKRQALPEVYE